MLLGLLMLDIEDHYCCVRSYWISGENVISARNTLFQICSPTLEPIMHLKVVDALSNTDRGNNGFRVQDLKFLLKFKSIKYYYGLIVIYYFYFSFLYLKVKDLLTFTIKI